MAFNFDLSLLLPEITLMLILASLALLEVFLPQWSRRFTFELNLAGCLGVGLALVGLLSRSGTTFQGMFVVDPFSLFFKFLFLGSVICVLFMSREGPLLRRGAEFCLVLWSALLGAFFLVSSKDFLLFFISLELLTLSIYILAAYARDEIFSVEAGLKYLVLGSLASAFLLYGISLIYVSTGTLSFDAVRENLRDGREVSWLFLVGVLLVFSALGFKVAAVPFHVWAPDVYQGAPTPVVAFLSVASKSAGFAGLLRILFDVLGVLDQERRLVFSVFAAMTLFYGNLGALVQNNMKRLLGFSSIGHAGFLLVALAAHKELGGEALLYYLIAYAVTNLTAFFVVSVVENSAPPPGSAGMEPSSLEAYRGLSRRSPLLASGIFIAFLSLAGVPPLGGFFAKFVVLLAAAKSQLFGIVLLGAINVAISLYYYLNVIRIVYFEKAEDETPLAVGFPSTMVLYTLMIGVVVVGVWQAPFFRIASLAAASLLRP